MKRLISVITVWLILGLGVWLLEAKEGVTTQIKTKKEDVSTRSSSKNLPPLQKKPPFKVGDVVGYSEPGLPERYIGRVVVAAKWGEGDEEVGLINYYGPRSLTIDNEGNIYILDGNNKKILKYDSEGKYLFSIPLVQRGVDIVVDEEGCIYIYRPARGIRVVPDGRVKALSPAWIQKYDSGGSLLKTYPGKEIVPQKLDDFNKMKNELQYIKELDNIEIKKINGDKWRIFLQSKYKTKFTYRPVEIQVGNEYKAGFEVLDEKGKVIRQVIVSLLPQTIIESERQGHILEPYIGGTEIVNIDEEDNIYIEVGIYYQTCIEVLASEDDDPEKVKIDKKTGKPMKIGKMITTGLSYFYKYDKTGENLLAILNQGVPGWAKDVFIDAYGEAHIPSCYKDVCWDRKGNFYQLLLRKSGAYIIKRSKNIGVKPRM